MKKSDFKVLKLNKAYMPIDVGDWKDVVIGLFSGAFIPCRTTEVDGELEDFTLFRNLDEWKSLTPKEGENFVHSANTTFIIPKIIICRNYDKVPMRRIMFPTKRNIWERDNYTCQYTGVKLSKEELSIDHILPKSRGGEDSWVNLVTCDRRLNSWKSDNTPEECNPKLKLIKPPKKPVNGIVFDKTYEEAWQRFIGG